jgi:chloride channel protein, CIC family
VRERLRIREETIHLLLATGVGIIGGVVNVLFFQGGEVLKSTILSGQGDLVDIARQLAWWQRLITPAIGGLAAGLVLCLGQRLLGRQGVSSLVEAVVAGDGRLPFRTGLIKTISSLISINTGASIGREGPIIQFTATLASKWGQLVRWPPYRLRLLVACGAASGLAAAYNAPVAGAVFAGQIVLGNFNMLAFAPLVLAAVVATIISRSFFGIQPFYTVPVFNFTSLTQLPWFLVLGICTGLLGALFLKGLRLSENIFARLRVPSCCRLGIAGVAVGIISLLFPEVWGNGYAAINTILHAPLPLHFLVGLFLAKVLATLISIGAGTVGGVFTPTLFMGATLGCTYGVLLHAVGWATELETGTFALVGMGSILGATVHSPLLAMIVVFELSLNYSLMPALMLACAVSTLVARRIHPVSVYTEPLRQKGVEPMPESYQTGITTQQTVGDLLRDPVTPLPLTAKLPEIASRFLTSSNNFLPIINSDHYLVGIVALQDLKEFLHAGHELNSVIAYDIMRPPPPCLTPNQRLMDALPIILASELRHIPVVSSPAHPRLLGSIARGDALGLLAETMALRTKDS